MSDLLNKDHVHQLLPPIMDTPYPEPLSFESSDEETPTPSYISNLSEEDISNLVNELKSDIMDISRGKKSSKRHTMFIAGGNEKQSLAGLVGYGGFSTDQVCALTTTLMEFFGGQNKYYDYVTKVLVPEALAMVLARLENIPYEDADAKLQAF